MKAVAVLNSDQVTREGGTLTRCGSTGHVPRRNGPHGSRILDALRRRSSSIDLIHKAAVQMEPAFSGFPTGGPARLHESMWHKLVSATQRRATTSAGDLFEIDDTFVDSG